MHLTLTNVVFEFKNTWVDVKSSGNLTLTNVVFEYESKAGIKTINA